MNEYTFLKPAKGFFDGIGAKDKVFLYFDKDGDGLTAGAIVSELLDEKGIAYVPYPAQDGDRSAYLEIFGRELKKHRFTAFISCDIGFDGGEVFGFFEKNKIKPLIIDHHSLNKNVPAFVQYVNPRLELPSEKNPSSSAIAYAVYRFLGGRKDLKWLGYIGAYTDVMALQSREFLELDGKEANSFMPNGQPMSLYGMATVIGSPAYLNPRLGLLVFKLLKESVRENNPILVWQEADGKAKPLFKAMNDGEREARKWLNRLGKKGLGFVDREKKLVYFKMVKPRLTIKRVAGALLGIKFPGYTTLAAIDDGKRINSSNRSPSVDLSKAIPKALEGIPNAEGGGHPGAAGCSFPKEYEKKFIEQFKALL